MEEDFGARLEAYMASERLCWDITTFDSCIYLIPCVSSIASTHPEPLICALEAMCPAEGEGRRVAMDFSIPMAVVSLSPTSVASAPLMMTHMV